MLNSQNDITPKNGVQLFNHSEFGQIRTSVTESGEPLFCLADLCKAINVANHRNVVKRIDEDGVHRMDITDSLGRNQQVLFVTEPGMYEVLLRSDSEKAKPFRKWVCGEVLPSIRKTGGYLATHAEDTPELIMAKALQVAQATIEKNAQLLEDAQKTITLQSEQLQEQAPKVAFANALIISKTSCLIGELAKLITQNGYKIGQNRLFAWMRENNYLGKRGENRNIPKQQYIEQGLFELKKGVRSGDDGVIVNTITPKVTGKGQAYFINKFISNAQPPLF